MLKYRKIGMRHQVLNTGSKIIAEYDNKKEAMNHVNGKIENIVKIVNPETVPEPKPIEIEAPKPSLVAPTTVRRKRKKNKSKKRNKQ